MPTQIRMHGYGSHTHRLAKRLFAACAIALFTLTLNLVGVAAAQAQARPAEGIFDNCDLSTLLSTCEQRLDVIHSGGFNVVVQNAANGNVTESQFQQYEAYAQSVHVKVMWELNEPALWTEPASGTSLPWDLRAFSDNCNCTTIGALTTYMVNWLVGLGDTYGFYAADDEALGQTTPAQLKPYISLIKANDSGKMVMVGANGGDGTNFDSTGATLGAETYPVTNNNLMPASKYYADYWIYYANQWLEAFQQSANQHHVPSAYILQAFTWGDNLIDGQTAGVCTASMSPQTCYKQAIYPSSQEQLYMRNAVIQHTNATLILWYNFGETYGQAGGDTYDVFPTVGGARARWSGLQRAIKAPFPLTAQQLAAQRRAAQRRAAAKRRAAAARARARRLAAARAHRR